MRKIFIDLSDDNYLQQPKVFGGYEGEHNETVLQVKLPKRMIDIECSGYRFDFQTSEDNKINSPLIPVSELNDDVLSFKLIEQLMVAGTLFFTIAAIQSDEDSVNLISKTKKVALYVDGATTGKEVLIDPNGHKDALLKMVDERIAQIGSSNVDQIYNPESENAQSGKAVAEGINAKFITSAKHEEPAYGENLVNADDWTLNGWSGDLENGFTSTANNIEPLVFKMPEETGTNIYRISFRCSTELKGDNLRVRCGNSDLFDLYGQLADPVVIGIKSVENGNLEFVPSTSAKPEERFSGTITDISIKRVTSRYLTAQRITDSNGELSCELRTTKGSQENTFLGKHSGVSNISGWGCAALGSEALRENTSGFWNVGIGHKALYSNTVGSRNVAIGYIALSENITGTRNIAIGSFALNHNKTGNKNIAIGADCLDKNISGSFNVAIGLQNLYNNTTGESNTAVGNQSMVNNTTGVFNVAIGANSLNHNTTGNYNMAMGAKTLDKCETGNNNVAIGYSALFNCVNGSSNTAIGYNAGNGGDGKNGTFKNGVFIGFNAGKSLGANADNNIFVGVNAGSAVTTGSNNICIGNNVQPDNSSPTKGYWLNIGDLIEGDLFRTRKYVRINGGLQLSDIPTSDPNVAGRVWNDNGTLKVSAG